jgi:crossover junction endodeoxyribonuclease RusA
MASFQVEGLPIPQGSVSSLGGHVVSVTPALAEWRAKVKEAAMGTVWGHEAPYDGPVVLEVIFYMPKPHKPKCNVPSVRPDGDKLLRAVQDAITATNERKTRGKRPRVIAATPGLITDDARIVDGHYRKRYAESGFVGALVYIREFGIIPSESERRGWL